MPELSPDNRIGQVQVIPFRIGAGPNEWETLILKRNEAKGGFWQPVTGGIEPEETTETAAYRELKEELDVDPDHLVDMIDAGYRFVFTDVHRGVERTFTEHVLAVILKPGVTHTISEEHTDSLWLPPTEAIDKLKYGSNKASLKHYSELVATHDTDSTAKS